MGSAASHFQKWKWRPAPTIAKFAGLDWAWTLIHLEKPLCPDRLISFKSRWMKKYSIRGFLKLN